MDKIYIDNLEIFAHHGVYEEEQRLGQKFVVSLVLYTDTRKAGLTDDLKQTINYGEIARQVTKLVQAKNHQLLECVAEEIARMLLRVHPLLKQVTVKLSKPWAPVGLPLETVGVEITRGWHEAYLSLGSNLGDKAAFLNGAVTLLQAQDDIVVEKRSDWIITEPYGVTNQPVFLNGCIKIRTLLTPEELLNVTQAIESQAGRERLVHWGPRTLDIDILFYENEIIGTERLVVPHPEIEKRIFVLQPMAQIAPWLRHPISRKTISQLLAELVKTDEKGRL
ncbi:MAG: 2-amino-4-hydroxy-6-hydroxymethyldihydropteridine diphosphokinase [Lachnospiraceae bacterium]|nr:2-amino-4-hydroxy-6-hydroxymethyldihydropteridine diphosphokinase [Lachnospiraceae bacterium]